MKGDPGFQHRRSTSFDQSKTLIFKEQCESIRHLKTISQRFLSVIVGVIALTVVFARPSWVDFFLELDPPVTGLTATNNNGSISNLTRTLVTNHGPILQTLIIMSFMSFIGSGIWAARVVLSKKMVYPGTGEQWITTNETILSSSRTHLKLAYIHAGFAIAFLIQAAIGFGTFYIWGGPYIFAYDLVNLLIPAILLAVGVGYADFTIQYLYSIITELIIKDLLCWASILFASMLYFIFVLVPSLGVLRIWLRLNGIVGW